MRNRTLRLAVILIFTPAIAFAQGPGGGSARAGGQGQGSRPGAGTGATTSRGTMDRDRIQQRDRLHTMATDQQRTEYRTCDELADRIRTRARDMSKSADGKGLSVGAMRQQRDQLREQVRTMDQEHQRMMQGLNDDQRDFIQNRSRTMEQIQSRINMRLQEMNQELAKENPDGKRISRMARDIERDMNRWRNEHSRIGEALGLSS